MSKFEFEILTQVAAEEWESRLKTDSASEINQFMKTLSIHQEHEVYEGDNLLVSLHHAIPQQPGPWGARLALTENLQGKIKELALANFRKKAQIEPAHQ